MASNYTQDAQTDYVKKRITDYFAEVKHILDNYPPPGTNAANGWVTKFMTDPSMDEYTQKPTLDLDGEALNLFNTYLYFCKQSETIFLDNPNYAANFWDEVDLIWRNVIVDLESDVTTIIKDILAITSLDPTKIATLIDDVKKYIDDIKKEGIVHNGKNMNGWVAVGFQHLASDAIANYLDKYFPSNVSTTRAGKIADAFRTALTKIKGLSKGSPDADNSKPWLRSEWQVGYYAAIDALFTALVAI